MAQKVNFSVEKLIDLVRQKPELWNRDHPNYASNEARDEAWELIADTFIEPEMDVMSCKGRWQNIRAARCKAIHRAFKYATTRPGTRVIPYRYASLMTFLGDHQNQNVNWQLLSKKYPIKSTKSMDETQNSSGHTKDHHDQSRSALAKPPPPHEIFLPENDNCKPEPSQIDLKKVKINSSPSSATPPQPADADQQFFPEDDYMDSTETLQEANASQESSITTEASSDDQYELWCKSLAFRLGKMEPKTSSLLMLKIQTLMHEAEFGALSK